MDASGTTPARGPLAGLKVVELGQLIAGPFAAKTLGDFGADVVKIVALLALHPSLIVLRISGYGQTGPYRDKPGFGGQQAVGPRSCPSCR